MHVPALTMSTNSDIATFAVVRDICRAAKGERMKPTGATETSKGGPETAPRLDRRVFLGSTAAAGIAGAAFFGSASCASLTANVNDLATMSEVELARHFRRLESLLDGAYPDFVRRMSAVLRQRGIGGTEGEVTSTRFLDDANDLARRAIRGLSIVGSYGELPAEVRDSRAARARIAEHEQELSESLLMMTNVIATCPPQDLDDTERILREDPDLLMTVAADLDRGARELGLGRDGRRRLRFLARGVQGIAARGDLVDLATGLVEDTERLARANGLDLPAAAWCSRNIWTGEPSATIAAKHASGKTDPESWGGRDNYRVMIAGATLLGSGAAVAAGGAIAFAASSMMSLGPGLVLTIGGLAFIIGIICLIHAAVRRALRRIGAPARPSMLRERRIRGDGGDGTATE